MTKFHLWMLAIIGVAALLIVAVSMLLEREPIPEEVAAEAKCMKDLKCWGPKHGASASIYCLSAMGHRAEEIKWTDEADLKLRHHRWLDRKAGTLTYYGGAIQMRNTVGAWVNYRFECDYDPISEELLALRLEPDR